MRYDKLVEVFTQPSQQSDGMGGYIDTPVSLGLMSVAVSNVKGKEYGEVGLKRLVFLGGLPRGLNTVMLDGVEYSVVEAFEHPMRPSVVVKPL